MKISKHRKAFTLIELMLVVAILGLLAAIAIPAFRKYMLRSKTTEARSLLRKIYDGELAYFDIDHTDRVGGLISSEFVNAGPEPISIPVGISMDGNWTSDGWVAIKFAVDSPVRYQYEAVASGLGTLASFTARAQADLDADGIRSVYERIGTINVVTGDIEGGAGLYIGNELE